MHPEMWIANTSPHTRYHPMSTKRSAIVSGSRITVKTVSGATSDRSAVRL